MRLNQTSVFPRPSPAVDPAGAATGLRAASERQAAQIRATDAAIEAHERRGPLPSPRDALLALGETLAAILDHPSIADDAEAALLVRRMAGAADMEEVFSLVEALEAHLHARNPARREAAAPAPRPRLLFRL